MPWETRSTRREAGRRRRRGPDAHPLLAGPGPQRLSAAVHVGLRQQQGDRPGRALAPGLTVFGAGVDEGQIERRGERRLALIDDTAEVFRQRVDAVTRELETLSERISALRLESPEQDAVMDGDLAKLDEIQANDVVVLELSSFQLARTPAVGWSPPAGSPAR